MKQTLRELLERKYKMNKCVVRLYMYYWKFLKILFPKLYAKHIQKLKDELNKKYGTKRFK